MENEISWEKRKIREIIHHLYPDGPDLPYEISQEDLSSIVDQITINNRWQPFPTDWKEDQLSEFIGNIYIPNIASTFKNAKHEYNYMKIIFDCLQSIDGKVKNPLSRVATHLILRAISAYTSACISSLAGQTSETHVLLRSCLEYGSYGFHIHTNPPLEAIWENRKFDEKSKKEMTQQFSHGKPCNSIEKSDASLAKQYKYLYEKMIDMGAHPNEPAVRQGAFTLDEEDKTYTGQIFLTGNLEVIKELMNLTTQTGVLILQIIKIMFFESFNTDEVNEKINQTKKYLDSKSCSFEERVGNLVDS